MTSVLMVVQSILLFLTTVIVIFGCHCITMTLDQNVQKSYSNSACPITLRDKITAANYDEFTTTHLYFQWWPDFEKKEIRAIVTLSMRRLNPAAKTVILDTAHLDIHKIYYPSSRQTLPFSLRQVPLKFSKALMIELSDLSSFFDLTIEYTVTPFTTAVQWLTREQTFGKTKPFLFTQLQPIHARSLFPCQDTPSVKATYTASVHVDSGLVPVMSAILQSHDLETSTFFFRQNIPIPSYLVALAVGDLDSRKIGPRSSVYAEPCIVEKAASEFEDTEEFIVIAERLTTPYVWGKYDILVLPPGFPFGGMENPCLTFVTPALLAGDKSLVNVIAHEIGHSWTGNLVTSATWEDFWLNEGHTRYLERKILGQKYGEKERHFSALIGLAELQDAVNVFGKDHKFTAMVPNLDGSHPDDAFSRIPYEKGHTLLFYMETLFGTKAMDAFLIAYIKEFANKSLSTAEWKDFVCGHFKDHPTELQKIDWEMWFYGRNMPDIIPEYDKTKFIQVQNLVDKWTSCDPAAYPTSPEEFHGLTVWQKATFMDLLHNDPCCTSDIVALIDDAWGITDNESVKSNVEIEYRWLRLALDTNYCTANIEAAFMRLVANNGRMKYIRPLYKSMLGTLLGHKRQFTLDTYQRNRAVYHPIAKVQIQRDLGLS